VKRDFLDLLVHMLQVRKDRASMAYRRVQAELQRVKGFKDQLTEYAQEYQGKWLDSARSGDTVQHLQVQMDFERRLRDTARAQEPEIKALSQRSQEATQQALNESQRLKTAQEFRRRKQLIAQAQRERAQSKEEEDLLQARHRGP
jgi:flagellar biosynthesis chaperone FliJ